MQAGCAHLGGVSSRWSVRKSVGSRESNEARVAGLISPMARELQEVDILSPWAVITALDHSYTKNRQRGRNPRRPVQTEEIQLNFFPEAPSADAPPWPWRPQKGQKRRRLPSPHPGSLALFHFPPPSLEIKFIITQIHTAHDQPQTDQGS